MLVNVSSLRSNSATLVGTGERAVRCVSYAAIGQRENSWDDYSWPIWKAIEGTRAGRYAVVRIVQSARLSMDLCR